MSLKDAAIACHRFGLGARAGELEAAARNPKRWLLEQIEGTRALPAALAGLPTTAEQFQVRGDYFLQRRAFVAEKEREARASSNPDKIRAEIEETGTWMQTALGVLFRDAMVLEWGHRFNLGVTTPEPFRERLVRFWSNHLVVPNAGGKTIMYLGSYEREAIRPHVAGRFHDMLMASAKHPAMLIFLDNWVSVGPNSPHGKASGESLNENLAREILELHTLGVDGGYTQDDVIELAKGISGWGVVPVPGRSDIYTKDPFPDMKLPPGTFHFHEDRHEPPPATLLGKAYRQAGTGQGEAMLHDLAYHPSTARFLASKLARHFVADEPPPALVERLAQVYLASDTNLAEMTRALVESEEAWQPFTKLRQPEDYVTAVARTLDQPVGGGDLPRPVARLDLMSYDYQNRIYALMIDRKEINPTAEQIAALPEWSRKGFEVADLYKVIAEMGQAPMSAPGPQGWYDRKSDWMGADSIMKRVEFGVARAAREGANREAPAFLEATLGPIAPEPLKTAVRRAATPEQGLALVLTSPEFNLR